MNEERKYEYPGDVTVIWNTRVYVVYKKGKAVAYCFTFSEAEEYAKEYAGYKGEGLQNG